MKPKTTLALVAIIVAIGVALGGGGAPHSRLEGGQGTPRARLGFLAGCQLDLFRGDLRGQ